MKAWPRSVGKCACCGYWPYLSLNHVDCDVKKPFRQLFGYAISAKRYALYSCPENEICIEKASGHGLGYLFPPKETKRDKQRDEEEVPDWIKEAWGHLLRRELALPLKEPSWLDLPAMMGMVLTTPDILKNRRPEWLGPFNFFLFPIIPEKLGGYPAGFDKSNFFFITPMESNRKRWRSLMGINLFDRRTYQISMPPSEAQGRVVPDSFRIILNRYSKKKEAKSLGPDGLPCTETTRGLLKRTRIIARRIIPVGKETDRKWEHGGHPSMLDPRIHVHETEGKMCLADPADRKRWSKIAVTKLIRESGLSPTTVYKILEGEPVRCYILSNFRQVVDQATA